MYKHNAGMGFGGWMDQRHVEAVRGKTDENKLNYRSENHSIVGSIRSLFLEKYSIAY